MNTDGRHQSTQHIAQFFHFDHLPEGRMRDVSKKFHDMAEEVLANLIDGPELTECLRKLLNSKDSAVRQALLMDRLEGLR